MDKVTMNRSPFEFIITFVNSPSLVPIMSQINP